MVAVVQVFIGATMDDARARGGSGDALCEVRQIAYSIERRKYSDAPSPGVQLSGGLLPANRLQRVGDNLKGVEGLSHKTSVDPLVVFVSHGAHVISIGCHRSKVCFLVIILHDSTLMEREFADCAWAPFAEY